MQSSDLIIGILAVQGDFLEHQVALSLAAKAIPQCPTPTIREVRSGDDVSSSMKGLIIPGGESTTISLFLRRSNLEEPLKAWIVQKDHVTWGTCAGMILLSKHTEHQKEGGQSSLGVTDTLVSRNYFGRQVDSFEIDLPITNPDLLSDPASTREHFPAVFIRAPATLHVSHPSVQVLASLQLRGARDSVIVAFRQGRVLSTAFHPELTEDLRWHRYFLKMVLGLV